MGSGLFISPAVREKLRSKHAVTEDHILECFANRTGKDLLDTREEHRTDPPTRWFISETDYGVRLKICFVYHPETRTIHIKTAYRPNEEEERIYRRHGVTA